MSLQTIFVEIVEDRKYQNESCDKKFDGKNTLNDWINHIIFYCGQASNFPTPPLQQRCHMIKVATIAIAACESFDRNTSFSPRHYEDMITKDIK